MSVLLTVLVMDSLVFFCMMYLPPPLVIVPLKHPSHGDEWQCCRNVVAASSTKSMAHLGA